MKVLCSKEFVIVTSNFLRHEVCLLLEESEKERKFIVLVINIVI